MVIRDQQDELTQAATRGRAGGDVAGDDDAEGTELQRDTDITEHELYVQKCPALAEDDTEGYPSDVDDELDWKVQDAETSVEVDGTDILEEIQAYIKMAVAAYSDEKMEHTVDMVKRSQMIRNVIDPTRLFGFGKTDTEVHVCILKNDSVVFAFRGTEASDWRSGFGDILTDLAVGQEPLKLYNGSGGPLYTSQVIKAHYGFQAGLKDVTDTDEPTDNLMHVLKNLGMDAGNVRRVVCVGHSLGGALATLCAKWCRELAFPEAEIGCVTIGSPRVGNVEFAKDFGRRVVKGGGLNYRVVNKRDVVAGVPNLVSYSENEKASKYKHVQPAMYMWEDEGGRMRCRVGGLRPTCLNLGFSDHSTLSYTTSVNALLAAPYKSPPIT